MKNDRCQSVRQIFDGYQDDMVQVSAALEEIRISDIDDADALAEFLDRAEKLEALVDLYAYLLACQDHNQPAR